MITDRPARYLLVRRVLPPTSPTLPGTPIKPQSISIELVRAITTTTKDFLPFLSISCDCRDTNDELAIKLHPIPILYASHTSTTPSSIDRHIQESSIVLTSSFRAIMATLNASLTAKSLNIASSLVRSHVNNNCNFRARSIGVSCRFILSCG